MKKLRGPDRADLLARYRCRIDESRKWRNADGYDELWDRLVDLYRGKHFKGVSTEDRIAINVTFATINVIAPSVSVNDPKLVVYAQKNEDGVKAVMIETVLNYWWRHYEFQPEMALAVKDYLVVGHGWLKVGWRYVEELKKVKAAMSAAEYDDDDEDDAPLVPQDASEKPANIPDDAETDASPEFEVTQDRPFIERVSPHDVFVDPEAKTLSEAKWIAQRITKALNEVKQDKRYRLKGRQALKPDSQLRPDFRTEADQANPSDDVQRVTVWEFYDMRLGTMCVFSDIGEELLLDPIPQPYAFGHPFVMLRNYEVPDFFYPMGDVEALEPLQMELDKTRSQIMNHRKRYDRKWLFRPDAFDAAGISALQTDQDNMMVPVATTTDALQDILIPIPITSIDPQLYSYSAETMGDIDKVSGVSEYQQGQSPNIRHTATEASMIQDAANSRAADKLGQIERCMGLIARRVIQLAQQYMTEDQEARVAGKNGYPVWVPFTREDVQAECDFEVEAGSTKPLNESQRRSQALQLLQTMTPYAASGTVNVQELIRYTLTYGFGIKSPDRFMMGAAPQGPPGEAQKAPKQSLIETMNYKDAPPDIQRQIEEAAGFQPSQVGGSSPAEALATKAVGPHIGAAAQAPAQAQQQAAQQQGQAQQAQAQAELQQGKHAHDASMAHQDHRHEHAMATVKAEHEKAASGQEHQQALEQQEQGGQQQMAQTMMQGAMQPPQQGQPGQQSSSGPETTATSE